LTIGGKNGCGSSELNHFRALFERAGFLELFFVNHALLRVVFLFSQLKLLELFLSQELEL
jgi:hypothetical protein